MAERIKCEKGFLVITFTPEEAKTIGFGIEEGCLCIECNNIIKDTIYYIAVLNDVMDEKCFNEWLKDAIHYSEDARFENWNYISICKRCIMNGISIRNL